MEIQIQQNVSLAPFCTYHTGGPARFFAPAVNWQSFYFLREFAKKNNVPYMVISGGSNILIGDEGFPGLVIMNRMGAVNFQEETVTAEGGVNLMKLILLASQQNLGGISGLANVPGAVGGAIYGNAGIPDIWIGDVLMHAMILPTDGHQPVLVKPEYFEFGYRTSKLKQTKDIVLSATLKLKPMPQALTRTEIDQYIKARALKQPAGNSCGSFFMNPGHFPSAGWLIEQAGCKGMTIGGAQVSQKHANFLMNTGKATTADILHLAKHVQQKVWEKFAVRLVPEVQIVPNNPLV